VKAIVDAHYAKAKELMDRIAPGKLAGTTVAFGKDEDHAPLQAADFLAYEWRKEITERRKNPHGTRREYYSRIRDARSDKGVFLHHYNSDAVKTIRAVAGAGGSLIEAMWKHPTTET
jgi:hypothetical protein